VDTITIKGIRDGLLVTLDDGPWQPVEAALLEKIVAESEFFQGARVALQVGDRVLKSDDIRKLRDKLSEHDVELWALLGKSAETLRSARRMDLETEIPEAPPSHEDEGELPPIDAFEQGDAAILVQQTLRSGRVVRHAGHVIILGDVNPGSQVIAGGHVVVWGRLRGTVHAGAAGDETSIVCALDMRPIQLRIASHVAIASDDGKPRPRPEIASVKNGQIVSEEWGSI
jgi:septum site-determining protein MinC